MQNMQPKEKEIQIYLHFGSLKLQIFEIFD